MLLKDLITLAKAGYAPATVKEILAMESQTETVSEEAPAAVPKEETQPEAKNEKPAEDAKPLPEDIVSALEKQLQQLKRELDTNKEALKKAQKENASRDNSANTKQKSEKEVLEDIARSYM